MKYKDTWVKGTKVNEYIRGFLTSTKKRSYHCLQDAYIDVFHGHITTIDVRKFF